MADIEDEDRAESSEEMGKGSQEYADLQSATPTYPDNILDMEVPTTADKIKHPIQSINTSRYLRDSQSRESMSPDKALDVAYASKPILDEAAEMEVPDGPIPHNPPNILWDVLAIASGIPGGNTSGSGRYSDEAYKYAVDQKELKRKAARAEDEAALEYDKEQVRKSDQAT